MFKFLFALFALAAAAAYGLLLYLDRRGRRDAARGGDARGGTEREDDARGLAARLSDLEALCRDLAMTRDDTRAALDVLRDMVNAHAGRLSEIERAVRELSASPLLRGCSARRGREEGRGRT